MAVHFIIGGEGSGKTDYIYREMLSISERDRMKTVYYFVPDQATLQAQKELVAMQENGCVMNIDILSFSRLKYRLSEELGDCFATVLDDIGKSMMLKKVLYEHDAELKIYGNKHRKPGFVDEMKSMLSELLRYLVDANRLEELSQSTEDNILSGKLNDLSVILKNFRELLGDRFLTEEDVYSAMCAPIERSEKLRNSVIFLSGFTGFTPSQFLLLRSLMRVSDEITFALTMDAELYGKTIKSHSMFHLTAETIAGIQKIADEEGILFDNSPVLLTGSQKNGALSFLKHNLFRRNNLVYREDVSDVFIRSFANRTEEIRALIIEIEKAVRTEGCRYRDIAVICGDVPQYSQEMLEMMEQAQIPCFIDYKTDIMNDPFVDFIRSALNVLVTDFRMDTVTHYTKNRLSGCDYISACLLDNYMLARGIRGYGAFLKPFTYQYDYKHKDDLDKINAIREQIASDLIPLRDAFRNAATVSDFIRVLYGFLVKHNCYRQMAELSEKVGETKHRISKRKSEEYRRIYEVIMNLLDTMNGLLGSVSITLPEFAEILDAGFREYRLSMIPPEQDCVTVGDVKRSRLNGIRYLFLLGVNDGSIPGTAGSSGILTEKEREQLKAERLELSELPKESLPTEEFYIYLACAKPSDKLMISYRRSNGDGREAKPSYILYRILNLLPKLTIGNEYTEPSLFREIAADRGRRSALRAILSEGVVSDFAKKTLLWFQTGEGQEFVPFNLEDVSEAGKNRLIPESISEDIVRALYGQCLKGSVTMLEEFSKCPFQLFLDRGLSLVERTEFIPYSFDCGNFMHEALYEYSNAVSQDGRKFHELELKQSEDYMQEAIERVLSKDKYDVFRSSNRNSYMVTAMRETLMHYVEVLHEQIAGGNFEPELFEQKFAFSSEDMELSGKIDRVDSCTVSGKNFVKVVDYKSGNSAIEFGRMYLGMQLQLPVYMGEVLRNRPEGTLPAAMFYINLQNPYVEQPNYSGDEEEEQNIMNDERMNAVRPAGIVLKDDTALTSLDHNLPHAMPNYQSKIIPVKVDKSGNISELYEADEMNDIIGFCSQTMHEKAGEIMSGCITRTPLQFSQSTMCDLCNYKDLCRNFEDCNGKYRSIPKIDKNEFMTLIRKEENDDGNSADK